MCRSAAAPGPMRRHEDDSIEGRYRPAFLTGREAAPTNAGGEGMNESTILAAEGRGQNQRYHPNPMPLFLRWLHRLGLGNPVAGRIVRGGSRRARQMYLRTGYLFVLTAVLLWSLLLSAQAGNISYRDLAAAGAKSFEYVSYLQIGLICVLAPVFMAGAIAHEASPRTWDVLLTTPLSASQIVLGNLLGRLFFVAALLFSSLPLFAVTLYFGGVPSRSIFASYAIALCAALLVGSIAISLAVSRIAGRRSVFTFYICVVSYLAATWAIDLYWRSTTGGVTPLTAANPFLALEALLNPTSYPKPQPSTLATMHPLSRWWLGSPVMAWCLWSSILSLLLVIAGSAGARTLAAVSEGRVGGVFRVFRPGSSGERHRPPRAVWHNPIAWREALARAGTLWSVIGRGAFLALGLLWAVGLLLAHRAGNITPETFQFALQATIWSEFMVIALIAINMSATAVSREREDGTLDLLLTTPITPKAYLGGKLRGLITFLTPLLAVPLGSITLAGLYVALDGLGSGAQMTISRLAGTGSVNAPILLPESVLLAPLATIPFFAFLVMVGLHWSVQTKGAISSVVATVGVVGCVAGILAMCGWQAGSGMPFVGPVLASFTPASLIHALIEPAQALEGTVVSGSLNTARIMLAVGVVITAATYTGIVYAMRASMVRQFDMKVRRLAGTK